MCNVLANHDQNLEFRFRLLKVCLFVKLESNDYKIYLSKSAKLVRSNLVQIILFYRISNSTQARFDVQGFIFYSMYKRKNPSYVLVVVDVLCVESLVRSRNVYLHTHLGLSRFMSRTWWSLQLQHKELKEDLKPLSGISKSQVRVLVVAMDQGKKQSVDLELSGGRGSNFSTRGSNRMLVI